MKKYPLDDYHPLKLSKTMNLIFAFSQRNELELDILTDELPRACSESMFNKLYLLLYNTVGFFTGNNNFFHGNVSTTILPIGLVQKVFVHAKL